MKDLDYFNKYYSDRNKETEERFPEFKKLLDTVINHNEQEKKKPLHDKLLRLKSLDWEAPWKLKECNDLIKSINAV